MKPSNKGAKAVNFHHLKTSSNNHIAESLHMTIYQLSLPIGLAIVCSHSQRKMCAVRDQLCSSLKVATMCVGNLLV